MASCEGVQLTKCKTVLIEYVKGQYICFYKLPPLPAETCKSKQAQIYFILSTRLFMNLNILISGKQERCCHHSPRAAFFSKCQYFELGMQAIRLVRSLSSARD